MSCGCANRMREILYSRGFRLTDGMWRRGDDEYADAEVEDHHEHIVARWLLAEARDKVRAFYSLLHPTG